ncbi:MAG TPA: protein-disulfide reductase DsbD domain-containing protein [Pyrinomonadaceae bacterium]|nr:protein-disulfide reductase DsbD domain-containing protein [Pyrinomonadaceae bacterium]
MRHRKLLLFIAGLLFACAACTHNAPSEIANTTTTATPNVKPTPAQIVRASADAVPIKAGGAMDASVRLQIADGYHINANPASFSYLIATELQVAPAHGLNAGKPAYPASVSKKFQFAPQPLAVYEHEALIKLPLRAAADAPKGTANLPVQVRVQACDEEKCFPPTTVKTDIPVTIN